MWADECRLCGQKHDLSYGIYGVNGVYRGASIPGRMDALTSAFYSRAVHFYGRRVGIRVWVYRFVESVVNGRHRSFFMRIGCAIAENG